MNSGPNRPYSELHCSIAAESSLLILTILALVSYPVAASASAGFTFSTPVNLSNTALDSIAAVVATHGSFVYVAYQENTFGGGDILFRVSSDFGMTFSPALNLSNDPVESDMPAIAVSGTDVYVAWIDKITLGNSEIFFRASLDNGASFGPVINLSNTSGLSIFPSIIASGQKVYVAWWDNTPGHFQPFFTASTNRGATFGPAMNIANDAGIPVLTEPSGTGQAFHPQIAAVGNNVYLAWDDNSTGDFAIFFRSSSDAGATFGPVRNLSNGLPSSIRPSIASIGTNVYVAWTSNAAGGSLDFRASTDNGTSFGGVVDVNPSTGLGAAENAMVTSGSNVYVTWRAATGFPINQIFFAPSTNNGTSFGSPIQLNNAPGSIIPAIAAQDQNVYVAWIGPGVSGNDDIFFRGSTDNGTTFGNSINLSNNPGSSNQFGPGAIVALGTHVYVVWGDHTPGNYDIFFTRRELGG